MKATPAAVIANPTSVKSNMWNGTPTCSSRKLEMMTFGGVPMRVVMPPNSDVKARGMRNREGGCSLRFDTRIATGSRRLTAPTLFMNAERNAVMPESAAILTVRYSGMREYQPAITSTTPEL